MEREITYRLSKYVQPGITQLLKITEDADEATRFFVAEPYSVVELDCNGQFQYKLVPQRIIRNALEVFIPGHEPGFYFTYNGDVIMHTPGFYDNKRKPRLTLDFYLKTREDQRFMRLYVGPNYILDKETCRMVFYNHLITSYDVMEFFNPGILREKIYMKINRNYINPWELDFDIFTMTRDDNGKTNHATVVFEIGK